jgi:hypothetical protein
VYHGGGKAGDGAPEEKETENFGNRRRQAVISDQQSMIRADSI